MRLPRPYTPFGDNLMCFLTIKLSPLKNERLFHSSVRKKGNVVGMDELERKFHITVWSKKMLIQKDENLGNNEEKKFPGTLPHTKS